MAKVRCAQTDSKTDDVSYFYGGCPEQMAISIFADIQKLTAKA